MLRVSQLRAGEVEANYEIRDSAGEAVRGGGGYGGPRREASQLVKLSMLGSGAMVGEVSPSACGVRLYLEDGSTLDAVVLRANGFEDDFWVAHVGGEQNVIAVVALDESGAVIGDDPQFPALGQMLRALRLNRR